MKILFVEDDLSIQDKLVKYLSKEYEVVSATTLEDAIDNLETDLILLDLNLPDGNGMSLISISEEKNIPVIVISVRNDESTIIKALDSGAYDYVTKPFSLNILNSRIKSVIRRTQRNEKIMVLDRDNRKFFLKGKYINLSQKEFWIMDLLLSNKGCVITRDTIFEKIWDSNLNFVEDNTLTVAISRLRNKIGKEYIETIRGIGYRLKL